MVEFDPRTFYDFANYIKGMTNSIPEEIVQAAYRTCISRAYYAAFLSTRIKYYCRSGGDNQKNRFRTGRLFCKSQKEEK
jgi:hypothetical protein